MKFEDDIIHIPSSENPLSADVVIIKTRELTVVFDVGSNDESATVINSLEGRVVVVLSHFHEDHIRNLNRIKYDELYCSKETFRHIHKGLIIKARAKIADDVEIIPLPSSHCKGCLSLLYHDYLFVADALYPAGKDGELGFNRQILDNTILTLDNINYSYCCISHRPMFINDKEAIMRWMSYIKEHL